MDLDSLQDVTDSLQVTYDNKPLYYFANDNATGDTNGDNLNGVWHLVTNQNRSSTHL